MTANRHLMILALLALFFCQGCGSPNEELHYTPGPVLPKLEQQEEDLMKEIDRIQNEVKELLVRMTHEIQDEKIDSDKSLKDVERTTEEVRALILKLEQRRGAPSTGSAALLVRLGALSALSFFACCSTPAISSWS
jgi:hypothetical protein